MEVASKRRTASRGRRPTQSTRRPPKTQETEGERRRVVQLISSLVLFLLVYIGRGIFPAQLEVWRTAAAANVDFRVAFQQFNSALSMGEPVQEAMEALCITLLGGEVPEAESSTSRELDGVQIQPPPVLNEIRGGNLSYMREHGIFAGTSLSSKGDKPEQAEPEPTQPEPIVSAIVTAMAQEYTDDGVKLPKNVSLAYYELGLSETTVPVVGTATSGFGYRDSPINGTNEFHLALDIGAEEGAEIGAFAAGTVAYIGTSDEFGNYLKINHENNVSSFYAHCSKLLVHKGDEVTCGQTVALVGHTGNATGPHLHLTIEKDNIRLDPAYYVDLS